MAMVLLARRLLTPLEEIKDAVLAIEDGIIAAVAPRNALPLPANARVVDFGDAILAPGMIDIHTHGGAGHDVMEASEEALAPIERLMAQHGVTSYCPTTVSAPLDQTLRSIEALGKAVEHTEHNCVPDGSRARPLGLHLEGPFLSHARRGVHPPMYLLPSSPDTFHQMWNAGAGRIRMLTLACELDGALDLIADASRRGVCVSIGHSNATLSQARAAIEAGARHATHTFNAMRPLGHRDPGLIGAILADNRITADIIADGIHVNPVIVDLFVRAKGTERAVLITDAVSPAGMPDGTYRLGPLRVHMRDGRCQSHGKLAGSVLTLDGAVRNTMLFAKLSFQDSLRLATLNPALVLGIEHHKGILQQGADADVTVFSPTGEVRQTIIGGILT